MLGEIVELDLEPPPETSIRAGQVIGWIEGFKAVSDVYAVVTGAFEGVNAAAAEDTEIICKDPYGLGWIYSATGTPDESVLDVNGYIELLDRTIDRMLDKPWQGADLGASPTDGGECGPTAPLAEEDRGS